MLVGDPAISVSCHERKPRGAAAYRTLELAILL
jgi:hypothetical protein